MIFGNRLLQDFQMEDQLGQRYNTLIEDAKIVLQSFRSWHVMYTDVQI